MPFFVRKEAAMKNCSELYDYYYGGEAEQYSFFRIPKILFTDAHFKSLSCEAKILYGLMLDRMSLSMKNGWIDQENRVYIYFTLEDALECMCCGHDKGVKLFAELDNDKGVGLIQRVKQGLGKPARIYVKNFIRRKTEVLTSEKPKSGVPGSRNLDFCSSETSNTDLKKTDLSELEYQSINPAKPDFDGAQGYYAQMDAMDDCLNTIKENLDYDLLCEKYDRERLDEIVQLLLETLTSTKKAIRIAGDQIPTDVVKGRLLILNSSHIEYVFECTDKNTTKIRNIKNYLLTALYNAPATITHYYQSEVNHDLYGDKSK